jgi:hypothetical protein
MKKTQFLFSAVAIVFATAGVFAPAKPHAATLDVAVTASPIFCALDGFCDQSNSSICRISSTGTQFYRLQGITCGTAATGRFYQ